VLNDFGCIRLWLKRHTLRCPTCGGQMSIISFIEEPKTIDRIIGHLKLTFEAERPPPPHNVQQELLMAAEESGEYF
jgi:hypothetical protein